jgi:hypothetical protein
MRNFEHKQNLQKASNELIQHENVFEKTTVT